MVSKKSKTGTENIALSVRQPWAWLIVNGYKDIENRSWKFNKKKIGNRIYIHAGQRKLDAAEYALFVAICKERKIKKIPKSPEEFQYGALVGTVVLSGIEERSKSVWAISGDYHWVLSRPKTIKPKKQKGQLGFFKAKI